MTPAHAPAPFRLSPPAVNDPCQVAFILDATGRRIADVWHTITEAGAANAMLFAHAPQLLAAANALIADLGGRTLAPTTVDRMLTLGRAVIACEGEQP